MYRTSYNMTEYPGLDARALTDDQIQKKLGELTSKMNRMSSRSNVNAQLLAIINILRNELQERSFKKSIENNPKWQSGVVLDTDVDEKESDDLDKLIDIG